MKPTDPRVARLLTDLREDFPRPMGVLPMAVSRWRVLRGCQLLLAFPASKASTVEAARAYARMKLGTLWRETMDVEPVRNPAPTRRVAGSVSGAPNLVEPDEAAGRHSRETQ